MIFSRAFATTLGAPAPTLGDDRRALRKVRGLTLASGADRLRCPMDWRSEVERGQSSVGIDAVRFLAALYAVPLSLFFGPAATRAG